MKKAGGSTDARKGQAIMNKTAGIKLPRLIGDGMVLQRSNSTRIWGFSDPRDILRIRFREESIHAVADASGRWSTMLCIPQAGGPYEMEIRSSSGEIKLIKDILVGEVWIASGQSNMELPMERVKDRYLQELLGGSNDNLRLFKIAESYDFSGPREELTSGSWLHTTPDSLPSFSAVSYFFQKRLNRELGVPIGIINASLGGSPAEAWMGEEMLAGFEGYQTVLDQYRQDGFVHERLKRNESAANGWYAVLQEKDEGLRDPACPWHSEQISMADWKPINVPCFFEEAGLEKFIGALWIRKTFRMPAGKEGKQAMLWLGTIVDSDEAYINGQLIGATGYQYPPRKYPVPEGCLKPGDNTIVLRILCNDGRGRVTPDKIYRIFNEDFSLDLDGEWHYRIGCRHETPFPEIDFVAWKPTGLYNAMLAPCHPYTIRGAIWYQGESNTTREPKNYEQLLRRLICGWREKWQQGDFPFLYVQLPNFEIDLDADSGWPLIREAQRRVLNIANTAMVTAIDIGEYNDLHPVNKKAVGERLALAARALAYGEALDYSGPVPVHVAWEPGKCRIGFDHLGGGLDSKDYPKVDWVKVVDDSGRRIETDVRIVDDELQATWDPDFEACSLQYAYENNPQGALLFNKAGLPASPFVLDFKNRKRNWQYVTTVAQES